MISEDFVNKYTSQKLGNESALGFINQADDFAVSTVVDVGTSLFNSIVAIPKLIGIDTDEYRIETYDVLKNVNEDYANYYNEARDTVETASFLAGAILPSGLAFKGMKLLQAGKLGFYPKVLSDVRQEQRISELSKLLELGQRSTSEFRNLRWKILSANAGQELAQMAGMEVAVVASLNQHAWMEDYLKDPVTNFAIGMALGGVLGTGIGQLQVRKQLRDRLGGIATEAMDNVVSKLIDIPLGISDVDRVQRFSINATILREVAANEQNNALTRQIAADFATRWEGMAGKLEQTTVLGPTLKASKDVEALRAARETMLSDAAFGANRVDFVTYDPKEFVKQKGAGALRTPEGFEEALHKFEKLWEAGGAIRNSLIISEGLKLFKPEWVKLMQEGHRTFYSPYHKAWIPASQIHNYMRAVDTGVTSWEKINVFKPNPDAFSEFAVRNVPTATADSYWLNTLGTVANAPLERKIYIMTGDLGVQNAWLSRLLALKNDLSQKQSPRRVEDFAQVYLIPEDATGTTAEIIKRGKPATLDEIEENLLIEKHKQIRALINTGASIQEIGIRLNIPVNTLEQSLMKGITIKEAGPWRNYVDAGKIESSYMSQTTRALEFTTNGHRIASLAFRNADMSAQLDAAKIKQQNREVMASIIAASESSMAKQFYDVLNRDDKVWDIFEQQLANIVNEKAGSFFFSSADFASRNMGDVGRIASIKGQEFFGIANNVSQQMLTNLSAKVRAATGTQIAIGEFNEVINVLQSMSGYRDIDRNTGMLFRLIEQEPGVFIREVIQRPDGTVLDLSTPMRDFLIEMRTVSRELWHMKNVLNKIQGFKELNDIGLWIPSFNPINKFISYVIDSQAQQGENRVKLLIGKTPEQLASLERDWIAQNANDPRFKLVTKSQQEDYNFWQMRTDPTEMDFADISKFHSGAAGSALPVYDDTFASTIVENLHNRIIFYGRKMQEMYLDDIMNTLDQMSAINQKYFAEQPTLIRTIGLSQREDAARSIKNVLLGNPNLSQYSTWQSINNGFASMIEWTSRKTQDAYNGLFEFDEKKRVLKKGEYTKFAKELEEHHVRNPFVNFNDYIAFQAKVKESSKFSLTRLSEETGNPNAMARYEFRKEGEEFPTIIEASYNATDKSIYIQAIESKGGPQSMGIAAMRELGVRFKDIFPDAKFVTGKRVSGVREEARARAGKDPFDFSDVAMEGTPITTAPIPGYTAKDAIRFGTASYIESLRVQETARRHSISHASAEKIIAAGNSVLATMALRVMETGHALITAISWPIMMLPEFYRRMPKTYLGTAAGEGVEVAFPARAIYDGIRFRHSDAAKPLIERWIKEGFGTSIVSEATNLNKLITTGGKGAITQINKIIESDLIKTLSKPSDFAEKESRLWVLSIGYQLARRMYPGISETGADMFAKEFMTRSIGNYYSAQRPAAFQGTLGVAIGLFQTYMLSWAQSAFRSIEEKQFKALASQMLAQVGLFGMNSVPMYDLFSKTIGEHFSDKHYDLQSGTYRALPDSAAEFLVYGLPASLGVGLYTRGDMQPRIPFVQDNPLDTIAAVNATRQFVGATAHTLRKVYEANGLQDKFRGLLEGIAMQSLSRPTSRIVELFPMPDGQGGFRAIGSISREGNTISTSADVWSLPGVASRLVASRSTEEQVKREVDYLNSFYGSVDHGNRKKATESLKTAIRGGNLTQEKLEEVAKQYLRTGTATGWRAALNEALATSEGGIDYKLGKRLRPDSPLMQMIDENY